MARYLAIDTDATGLYIVAATTGRGSSITIEKALVSEDSPPLGPATARALGTTIRELLKAGKVAPAPVLLAFSRERVIVKDVRYPPTSPSEEPAIVKFQATKDFTEALEDVSLDYTPNPIADATGDRQATVMFLRRDLLAAARVMCETAGLKLTGVTARPHTLAAAANRAILNGDVAPPEPGDAPVGVVMLHPKGGEFIVMAGPHVRFSRSIPAGAVASEENLINEIRRNVAIFSGMSNGGELEALYLAEGDLGSEGLVSRIRAALPIPVNAFDPLAGSSDLGRIDPSLHGRFAGAVGLASLRSAGVLPINFQQPRQPRTQTTPARSRATMGVLLSILFLGGLAIGGMFLVDNADSRTQTLRNELKNIENDIKSFELDQKRMAAAEFFTEREIVWADELYDLSARFPDIDKMRVTRFEGVALPPPTEKERQKQVAAAKKANTGVTKKAQPLPVARLKIELVTNSAELPGRLVTSFNTESKYYDRTRITGGGTIGTGRTTAQQYSIETNLIRRHPGDYTRRMNVSIPKAPPAPIAPTPKPTTPDEPDTENQFFPGPGEFGGGFNP